MVSKHQRHLMNIARRKKLAAEKANSESPTPNKQETVMHTNIEKAKTFVKNHKKAFIIGGSIAAAVLAAVVARKVVKSNSLKAFQVGQLSGWGFDKPARSTAMSEIKIEKKSAMKGNLISKLPLVKMTKNDYNVAVDGQVTNLKSGRILKTFKNRDGLDFVALVWDKKLQQCLPVDSMMMIVNGDYQALLPSAEAVTEAIAEVTS